MFKNVASVGRHPLRGVTEKCAHPALPCLAAAKAVRHRCFGKTYAVGGPAEQVAPDIAEKRAGREAAALRRDSIVQPSRSNRAFGPTALATLTALRRTFTGVSL